MSLDDQPVTETCRVLQVSRAAFYAWKITKPTATQRHDDVLAPLVSMIFRQHKRRYGARRIAEEKLRWVMRLTAAESRTRSGQRLMFVVSGDRDPGSGSTSRMVGEVAVCLALDLPKSALSGGFWTPGAAIADKIIPRLVETAGMQFDVLTESGERFPVESELFSSDVPKSLRESRTRHQSHSDTVRQSTLQVERNNVVIVE